MRIPTCLAMVAVGLLAQLLPFNSAPGEESPFRATLSYSELISYGMINAYSTNVLVQISFAGGCLTKEDALEAVERNLKFVRVLQRYAHSLRRASADESDPMKKLLADMCEVTTYLERQTESLRDWLSAPESKSARMLYEGHSNKVEEKMELMFQK